MNIVTVSISMPTEMRDKLDRLQRYKRLSRSKVVQDLIYEAKEPKERK